MEYPRIEKTNGGLKVHVTKGSSLPGIYTDYLRAEKALEREMVRRKQITNKKKA